MNYNTKTQRILRLILLLSNSYPKTKNECCSYLEVRDSAFYNYCNDLKDTGFNVCQKDGKYWIDYSDQDHSILRNVLHFSEEEIFLISQAITNLDGKPQSISKLKMKLTNFFNQDKSIEAYLKAEKPSIVQYIQKAKQLKRQIMLLDYASGNSQTVKNRMVEPFEFKDDFNLIWAFDTELKQNRQFKICRIKGVQESNLPWEYSYQHRSKPVDIFRNTGDLDKYIEFNLNLRARNLLIEEYPLAESCLSTISRSNFEFKAKVAKYEGPGRFVLGVIEDVQIIGDEDFKNFLRSKIKKYKKIM